MHLIEVRDVYKIYNPGENQVNALDGVCCHYRSVRLR